MGFHSRHFFPEDIEDGKPAVTGVREWLRPFTPRLERNYEQQTVRQRTKHVRFYLWLGIAITLACLPLDWSLGAAQLERGLWVRAGIVVPLHLIALWALRQPLSVSMQGATAIVPMVVSVAATAYLGTHAPQPQADRYFMAAGVLALACNMIVPFRPVHAVLFTLLSIAALNGIVLLLPTGPVGETDLVLFLSAVIATALVVNLRQDRNNRHAFLLGRRDRATAKKLRAVNDQLQELSTTDQLTGLNNRRHFDDAFARAWEACRDSGAWLGVMMIDIDHFKNFNDRHGHAGGDVALKEVAGVIEAHVRADGDTVARYGGEEFVALFRGLAPDTACERADAIRRSIADTAITLPGTFEPLSVTASIGVATKVPTSKDGRESLLHSADEALYTAKEAGRDCVVHADEGPQVKGTGFSRGSKRLRIAG